MRMRTWVGPGSGVGISRTSHGAPAAGTMAAFMAYSLSRMRRAVLHASVHPSLTLPIARFEVGFTNPANAGGGHALPRGSERAVEVDAAHAVLHDEDLEALPARVEGRVLHAKIGGEAGEEEPPAAALPQVAGEAGARPVVILVERRIGIDGGVAPLPHDDVRPEGVEAAVQLRAGRA